MDSIKVTELTGKELIELYKCLEKCIKQLETHYKDKEEKVK